mmetsp:Transcript_13153/g.22266  ORF Transcript_13153/g.22266 Transcript_13153/m.22266 type:complete len:120 (+) Transcript_13153:470-829(+)
MEDQREVIQENERLYAVEIDYLKHLKEQKELIGVIPSAKGDEGKEGQGDDEIMELKNRTHLLTEENQVLFQQVQVLRASYDQFNKEVGEKMEEAQAKSNHFQSLQAQIKNLTIQKEGVD